MKQITLIFLSLVFTSTTLAQETVIWGSEVIDVSTEFSPYEYSAIQVLHRPNVLPKGGENPNAWRPKRTDKEEFIVVTFSTPIKAKQVAIAESENPGAVKQVFAYDEEFNEYTLFELTPRTLPIESRLLNLFFEETTYEINAIKVVLDGSASEGYNALDAIGISASNIPINVLINLAPGLNNDVEADRLSENVNSPYVEHSPLVSPDGKRMYFSRQYHPENVGGADDSEDIWVSELDEETGEWSVAKNVGPPLNTEGPNFISSISEVDGEELIILGNRYGKNGRMYTGVSVAKRDGDSFTKPKDVEIEDEYNYSPNADYFLVPGGEAMLLSAERDDTFGKRDLYVSFKQSNGKWTVPKNLGNEINTSGEDESPFLAADGRTLYFSSDGYNGYGGADIYVSFKEDDTWTNWSTPENMGANINKEGDDEYFSIPANGQHLYFTRGEKGEDTDIFSFKVEELFEDKTSPLIASVEHLAEPVVVTAEPTSEPVDEPEAEPMTEPEPAKEVAAPVMITIKGKVLDSKTNNPIENAKVSLERFPDGAVVASVISAASTGAFSFEVKPGTMFGITAEKDGYLPQDENLDFRNFTESKTVDQNVMLVPIEKEEVIVLRNLFFDFDQAEIKTASFAELKRVLGYLADNRIDAVEISGHTDTTGPDSYNLDLSQRRAKAVMDFLVNNGISKDRLSMKSYGETKPVVSNDTRANRAKNRRVEFTIK